MPMISIRVPEDQLAAIDEAAQRAGMTRTDWMISRAAEVGAADDARLRRAVRRARTAAAALATLLDDAAEPQSSPASPRTRRAR